MKFNFKNAFGAPRGVALQLDYLAVILVEIKEKLKNKQQVEIDFTGFEHLQQIILQEIVNEVAMALRVEDIKKYLIVKSNDPLIFETILGD